MARSSSNIRISVSRSRAGLPSFPSSRPSSWARHGSIRGRGWLLRLSGNSVACDRIALRTTLRDTRNSRQIVLIGLFWAKYARRFFTIVSTTSTPALPPVSPTEATVDPPSRGSRLDADHPENGVLIPCRSTVRLRPSSNEAAEQGRATGSGGGGAKGGGQGEREPMPHVPDTVPGKRVTDAGARTEGRGQPSNIRGGSRMQESCPYGSVRGAPSNGCPYRNSSLEDACLA